MANPNFSTAHVPNATTFREFARLADQWGGYAVVTRDGRRLVASMAAIARLDYADEVEYTVHLVHGRIVTVPASDR